VIVPIGRGLASLEGEHSPSRAINMTREMAPDHAVSDRTSLQFASPKIWEYRRKRSEIFGRDLGSPRDLGTQRPQANARKRRNGAIVA
jgi:hypothetical protein